MAYRHTQSGRLWVLIMIAIFGGGLVLAVVAAHPLIIVMAALMGCLPFLFSSLTVALDGSVLEVFFGPGLIRRQISLDRIRDVQVVRNPWYYGWGIRLTPRGWLWNISGFDAVELTFDDGHHFRIGSDEPERLAAALREDG